MLPEEDRVRLRHMVEAAQAAIEDTAGLERVDLDSRGTIVRSVLRCMEVIGEAASRVSSSTRDAVPGVPWRQMVAMRNRLIHTYWGIDLDAVWITVKSDLPALLADLREALGEDEALDADPPPS